MRGGMQTDQMTGASHFLHDARILLRGFRNNKKGCTDLMRREQIKQGVSVIRTWTIVKT